MRAAFSPANSRNFVALALLVLAKVLGIGGLIVAGSGHRTAGAVLLALDGVLLVAAVVICLRGLRARKSEDEESKAMLAKMVREGTLKEFLREVEQQPKSSS